MKIFDVDEFSSNYLKNVERIAKETKEKLGRLPNGFEKTFLFHFGTIAVDDKLEGILAFRPEYASEIRSRMIRFKNDDWGCISHKIAVENNSERKFFGDGTGLIAVYEAPKGYLRFDTVSVKNRNGDSEIATFVSWGRQKDDVYPMSAVANYNYNKQAQNTMQSFLRYASANEEKALEKN